MGNYHGAAELKSTPASDEWRSAPSRKAGKDKKRFCGGNERRGLHDPVVQLDKFYARFTDRKPCGTRNWSQVKWHCSHQSVCSKCGKILEWTLGTKCPDRPL